jgi:phosphatidylserine/phosphatidylglycerophosphate/cardiolipin synthase-like enzyme
MKMINHLPASRLYDNETFYGTFVKDLQRARSNVYIESPFITLRRMNDLLPIFVRLRQKGVHIVVNTRDPDEHDYEYETQARIAVQTMQDMGVNVLYTVKHHRKLAVIDDEILWEGSLNVLSQNDSCEIMRRSKSRQLANQMMQLLEFSLLQFDFCEFDTIPPGGIKLKYDK